MRSLDYRGSYRGVFPIKVNQQCQVIEEIARFGARYGHGLEAGSKAELLIALAQHGAGRRATSSATATRTTSSSRSACRRSSSAIACLFVLETPTELPIILEASRALGIRPMLGVRVKLAAARRRRVERVERRPQHLRPHHRADRRADRLAARARDARLPAAAALPPRLADPQHPRHPQRRARGRAATTST